MRPLRASAQRSRLGRSLIGLAHVLAALAVVQGVVLLAMFVAWRDTAGGPDSVWQVLPLALFLLASPTVGALIVARARHDHAIGWLFIVCPGALAFGLAVDTAVTHAVVLGDGSATAAAWKWAGSWMSVPAFASLPLIALLFPDGRPASRRWTPVIWTTGTGGVLLALSEALRPEIVIFTGSGERILPNPFAIPALGGAATVAGFAGIPLIIGSVLLAMVALVLRFRRSRGVERQQLKWFVLAMGTLATLLVTYTLIDFAGRTGTSAMRRIAEVIWILAISSLALLPLAAGMAILRYRLYDIDVLINRALVYGAVSALLAATYVLGVVALSTLLRPLTGGTDVAVAGSTLAVVALFQPLRDHVQRLVDKRFYRARYDAVRTVDAFSVRLRDQVDIDQLHGELVGMVHETMQPAHASLWLRRRA